MRLDRLALKPVRAAARSSQDALTEEAERAIDAVCAGPLPEALGRALAEHRVVERVGGALLEGHGDGATGDDQVARALQGLLRSPALERWLASGEAARLAESLATSASENPAFRQAIANVVSSDEVRGALERQTLGFAAEVAAAARERAARIDDALERGARRLLRRPRAGDRPPWAGLATRAVSLVADAGVASLVFVLAAASVSLVLALVGGFRPGWATGTGTGAGWLLLIVAYFVGFWSGTGQTPGMRLMRLRVATASGARPSVPRSLLRFAGLLVSIAFPVVSFVPIVVDERRRALHDFLARTAVIYEPADRP